jgi:hypothetical protein
MDRTYAAEPCITDEQRQDAAQHRDQQRLIEDEVRVRLVFAADRVRDQRDRADTEHLCHGHDDEHRVAGCTDASNGCVAEPRDEIEVDEEVKRLEDHSRRHRHRHGDEMARDRSLGKILHKARKPG